MSEEPILVKQIAKVLDDKMTELGIPLRTREGYQEGRWIVMDYGTVLVHIFHPEAREYYHLERLWADGTNAIDLSGVLVDDEKQN